MNPSRFKQINKSTEIDSGRRQFLKVSAGASAGLVLGVNLGIPAVAAQNSGAGALEFNAFVSVTPDNIVRVLIKNIEMGQGPYTGHATCIAEEMDADWDQVVCEHAPVDTAKYANLLMGQQATGGSSSIAAGYTQMREAGSAARAMLVAAAAEQWQVSPDQIKVEKGVLSTADHSATFGEMAVAASQQAVPAQSSLTLKSPDEFTLIGSETTPRKDLGKHNGTAIFTQDVQLPGMLSAVVAHSPRFGGRVRSFDSTDALAVKGVEAVLEIDSGVAVLARDYWSANKGRAALKIEWDDSDAEMRSSSSILQEYHELVETAGVVAESTGDAARLLNQADQVIDAVFEFPYLAHAQMEPLNCVAQVSDDSAELWYGCQGATIDQLNVATRLNLPVERVKINTVFSGGGFGRRSNPVSDYVMETIEIAAQRKGQPIKLVWSREDDMEAGYYRPAFVHKMESVLDSSGKPSAIQIRVAGQSIMEGTPFAALSIVDGIDVASIEGLVDMSYAIPQRQVELHSPKVGVPVQWWRSVGNTHTAFSKEVFIDMLAQQAGQDPVAYRLALLENNPKETAVLKLAAEKAGWGEQELAEGWGRGVAIHSSFGSTVAEIVDVSVDGDSFKVERVVAVVDCGVAVNPDIVRAQIEGGIAYGLSAALADELTLSDGIVDQNNFHTYKVLRMNAMPKVEVHILPSDAAPTGVGEPGTPPIAPALANALAAATGKRLTRLPLKLA